ncbi:MAG: replication-associated recombination protein A [Opitutales bacterium]|nr:replication-associated recombination protein A [Opitutales bacterium]
MDQPEQMDFFGNTKPTDAGASGEAPAQKSGSAEKANSRIRPLAARMRPRTLGELVGQRHLLGEKSLLVRLLRRGDPGNVLLYGPPGCGKTSLAEVIARETRCRFVRVNAVQSNVAELRRLLDGAKRIGDGKTVLFIDEIHRFNKAQQDLLLPDVEEGHLRLIGATTHNPGFYVIPPLVSRSQLFRLEPLAVEDLITVIVRALEDSERGLGDKGLQVEEGVLHDLALLADGDPRKALNALEVLAGMKEAGECLTIEDLKDYAHERQIRYDADEDEHYDTISAFIKSIRGGDPDAALYWLAKMLAGGEDPRFIARRLVILASEDVGLADPAALPLAVSVFQACEMVGLPEAELTLAHGVTYLATAPKSNTAYRALAAAKKHIRENPVQPVPLPLRDKGGSASKRVGHGAGYKYSHDFPEAISGQAYWEESTVFYESGPNGAEKEIAERLARWRELRQDIRGKESPKSGKSDCS